MDKPRILRPPASGYVPVRDRKGYLHLVKRDKTGTIVHVITIAPKGAHNG